MQGNVNRGCNPDGSGCPAGVTGQTLPWVTSGIVTAAFVNSATTRTNLAQNNLGNFALRVDQQDAARSVAARIRPNPQFAGIAYLSNGADSVYHSMQASLKKRFAAGFQFNTAFTWSRAIDNQSSDPVGTGSTPS